MINLRGEVEIVGKENDKITYYDKGDNLVTYWARHAVMRLLTGDSFGTDGAKRSIVAENHTDTKNSDGTLLSGQQYFYNNTLQAYDEDFYWSKSVNHATKVYPFMPVKMLLGTGLECTLYSEISSKNGVDEWGDATNFNSEFSSAVIDNSYSNIFDSASGELTKARTVNSNSQGIKTSPEIEQKNFGISGAIKNGGYENTSELSAKTIVDTNYGRILQPKYRGIGEPSFIYSLRGANTFENSDSEVRLSRDGIGEETIESKITFTVVLPQQTGENSDAFYPYNGYTIKEVGLFTDAALYLNGDDTNKDLRMPYGMLFAKRYIAPFTKTANSSFTIRWTIYI